MVPFSAVAAAIGADVEWNAGDRSVICNTGDYWSIFLIGASDFTTIRSGADGWQQSPLDVPAQIVNGRTLLPVRALAESLHCSVAWDGAANTVSIETDKSIGQSLQRGNKAVIHTRDELYQYFIDNVSSLSPAFAAVVVDMNQADCIFQMFDNVNFYALGYTWTSSNCILGAHTYTQVYYSDFSYTHEARVAKAIRENKTAALTGDDAKLYQRVQEIIQKQTSPGMSDYAKELAIHDYLGQNVVYDLVSRDAYTALMTGKGNCQGFANSFKLILNTMGMECDVVTGGVFAGSDPGQHAWNIVKLDGDYYMVDVTWDIAEFGYVVHSYFNVTDAFLSVTRTRDTDDQICVATRYNYFVHNNLRVTSQADFEQKFWTHIYDGNCVEFQGEGIRVGDLDLSVGYQYPDYLGYTIDDLANVIVFYRSHH